VENAHVPVGPDIRDSVVDSLGRLNITGCIWDTVSKIKPMLQPGTSELVNAFYEYVESDGPNSYVIGISRSEAFIRAICFDSSLTPFDKEQLAVKPYGRLNYRLQRDEMNKILSYISMESRHIPEEQLHLLRETSVMC
jgi:hypothetical protein